MLPLAAAVTGMAARGTRDMVHATGQHWLRVLLSALGGLELFSAISAAPK